MGEAHTLVHPLFDNPVEPEKSCQIVKSPFFRVLL